MAGLNKVMLIGYLGRDPEVRRLNNGNPVVSFRMATSESWRNKTTGERQERTEWHNVVVFNEGLCKVAEQYLKKGSHVYVEGMLQTRKWQDQQGTDRYTTEVVLKQFGGVITMLGGKGEGGGDRNYDSHLGGEARATTGGGEQAATNYAEDLDDEIPF